MGTNYSRGNFCRSITNFITGDISVDGQYNLNNVWTTVGTRLSSTIYNGDSIFKHLPNITGIKLDGSLFASTIEGITNIDLQNIHKLITFSIQNCSNLTDDIDLSECENIEQVDASGTSVNIILPTSPKVTKYELGSPTSIRIINPTILQPSAVLVDSSANIDSLELVNIPNNKSYSMFDKIT
jgi:hypothetical protein